MGELLAIAFLGGFITGVSPCIVPVLPVVVAGGSTGTRRARPFLIIAGLVLSFSLAELLGSTMLSALGLPQDLLFWLGISVLLVLALGLLVPTVGYWTERPFSRLGASRQAGRAVASSSASASASSSCPAPARCWPPSRWPPPTTG